ncbi:hypothetical protein N7456_000750 [Penicillium angulare]|uniref:Mediator of RNA polymerase II transcription subunit 12 n=1 Tax=Penicillium angulare TaxID=116970 RepID=A0A9W9KR79_9EURO|nr:hypothetical protein N7456_000750 [Penicillium angulare]
MIPHSSAGGQSWGHPMRSLNGGPGRIDITQVSAQYDPPSVSALPPSAISNSQPQSQAQTRQPAVVDLTGSGCESHDKEPPQKRPRLDVSNGHKAGDTGVPTNGADMRSTPGSASSRPQLSWRGRPMWSFQAVVSEAPGNDSRGDIVTNSRPSSPPPFPALPWSNIPSHQLGDAGSSSRGTSPEKKVQTTPYQIETPSVAPVLTGNNVADFTPWTGSHPEDILNEQTAKQGYYDRTQVSQNESNTARPALYGQLKHRTGLQMLSAVFSTALEKRQTHNTVHAPSTFKPPPRVTLTDNKREAWLRDLANSHVPLRRLSRTIPHGIRGKVLLDQCLGKSIPVGRAIWLAKCVGANEIRAFKRKGTSGALAVGLEAKWVRDWTTSVQQFLENVTSAPKSPGWNTKMIYGIGLTARLFFENLLDHDHFIEWFLISFESASLATVPVWLLMLGIYWHNVMRYRRRGRRLAEVLLEKLRQATEARLDTLQPLVDRLSRFVKRLAHENASSLVLPNSWSMYKTGVTSCLDLSRSSDRALLQNLTERNARIERPRRPKQPIQRSAHQHIIRLLDSVHSALDVTSISAACLDVIDDEAILVSKLLEWTATPFRHGISRVYVGSRLLRKWKATGVDVDGHVLTFLTQVAHYKNLDIKNVYHTVSELVRSQTFSVGRYLQWLMAKGITNRSHLEYLPTHKLPSDVVLITQLPLGRLPEHVRNLRNTLLSRTGVSIADEINVISSVKDLITQRLPNIYKVDAPPQISLISLPMDLSWTVKAELSQWLRLAITEHTRSVSNSTTRVAFPGDLVSPVSMLTPDEFYTVRDILEKFGDISILADVLKVTSSSDNAIVLASVADTTNCHFDSLSVIGATSDLFRKLVDAYASIKRFSAPSLELIFSLIELGLRIPTELHTVAILRQDLSRMENKAVLAASSPVSDHIPDSFGDADPLFREKLDHILFSGNVMDEPTLDAIFGTLTKNLETETNKMKLSASDTCRYLSQLRSFQPKHFDGILARWICDHLRSHDRSILLHAIPSLIGVGCVTIRSFLSLLKRINHSRSVITETTNLPADFVELLTCGEQNGCLDLVSYRFHLARSEFLVTNCENVLDVVCDAATFLRTCDRIQHGDLEVTLVRLLREVLVRNPSFLEQHCMKRLLNEYPAAIGALRKALDGLLGVESQKEQRTVVFEVENLASTTDDFSLPFCQLKLQILFHEDSKDEDRNCIADAMFKTAVSSSGSLKSHWIDLVGLMNPDDVRQIRERAEKEFLSIPVMEDESDNDHYSAAKMYLTIIEELANSIPDVGTPSLAIVLVEKMDALLHKLVALQNSFKSTKNLRNASPTSQGRPNLERSLAFWFSTLLRMVVIHRASFMHPPALKQSRLLVIIFCIALSRLPSDFLGPGDFLRPESSKRHPSQPAVMLQTYALDVAASLIDGFSDEVRHHCSRFLREKCPPFAALQNDPRFVYLLGPIGDFATTNLLQSTSAPSPVASGATPGSTANVNAPAHLSQYPATPSGTPSGMAEAANFTGNRLRLQHRGRTIGSYPIRPWELLEDAAPFVSANDTAVNLSYFNARRVRV